MLLGTLGATGADVVAAAAEARGSRADLPDRLGGTRALAQAVSFWDMF